MCGVRQPRPASQRAGRAGRRRSRRRPTKRTTAAFTGHARGRRAGAGSTSRPLPPKPRAPSVLRRGASPIDTRSNNRPTRSNILRTRMNAHSTAVADQRRLLGSAMKCLALLDVLAAEPGPAGVSELARLTKTPRGTTYQQLQTLVAAGWAEPVGEGKYRLTLRALVVGSAVLEQADLGSRVLPTLASIAPR